MSDRARRDGRRLSEPPRLEPLSRQKGPPRSRGTAAAGPLYRGVALRLGDRARQRASRRRTAVLLVLAVLAVGAAFLVSPLGRPLRATLATVARGLPFGEARVVVRGNEYLTASELIRAAGLEERVSFFRVDLEAADRRLSEHRRVADARASRRLDGKIVLAVRERRPVALLPLSRPVEVDAEGRVLPPLLEGSIADLPLVRGLDTPVKGRLRDPDWARAVAWLEALGAPAVRLLPRVSEIDVRDPRTTVLVLAPGGTRVLLPGERSGSLRLAALCIVLADLEGKRVAAESIDCRASRMVVVRPRAAPEASGAPVAETPKPDRLS